MSEIIEKLEKLLAHTENPEDKKIVRAHLERNKKQLEELNIPCPDR